MIHHTFSLATLYLLSLLMLKDILIHVWLEREDLGFLQLVKLQLPNMDTQLIIDNYYVLKHTCEFYCFKKLKLLRSFSNLPLKHNGILWRSTWILWRSLSPVTSNLRIYVGVLYWADPRAYSVGDNFGPVYIHFRRRHKLFPPMNSLFSVDIIPHWQFCTFYKPYLEYANLCYGCYRVFPHFVSCVQHTCMYRTLCIDHTVSHPPKFPICDSTHPVFQGVPLFSHCRSPMFHMLRVCI